MKYIMIFLTLFFTSHSLFASIGGIELFSRATYGDYEKTCYSFLYMSQDSSITLNNYEIQFGNPDNTLTVNMVTDDLSFIIDLGRFKSCDEIANNNTGMASLAYVGIDIRNYSGGNTVDAIENHCYLSINNDSKTSVITLFRVKKLFNHDRVIIDQIHNFKRIEHYDN
ncbi:MAG: hypothetical protein COV57_02520 [Candidatus Liptonbacteria bacterium CG11_big_fil_rev_8_21_14_0_20_35_14]|uniref:LTD domain-containing protein n=1 Tax=Candidatus Liptonbacteria bacterium CG11_big_fil_rev_8_21_14_0_20_35_14 TaxID=1974634 RepID=A0A2H0N7B0_9BACT|nr:MAG: hypothetical protein COV57_02520 [Candidatus Liptonbacteria bacterium CG11_big_fil_rev_8_21_14_0_20_35_14]